MVRSHGWIGAFVAVLSFTALAEAQCLKDTDCKGDRVCDAGACRAPTAEVPQDPNGWDVGAAAATGTEAPAAAEAPATARPPAAPVVPGAARAAKPGAALEMREPSADAPDERPRPKMRRRSTGMMAAGIVMVSISPLALIGGAIMAAKQTECDAYDGLPGYRRSCDANAGAALALTLTGLALVGAGIPLIVIGGKRVPAKEPWQAQVLPYADPDGTGLRLRLQL